MIILIVKVFCMLMIGELAMTLVNSLVKEIRHYERLITISRRSLVVKTKELIMQDRMIRAGQ